MSPKGRKSKYPKHRERVHGVYSIDIRLLRSVGNLSPIRTVHTLCVLNVYFSH